MFVPTTRSLCLIATLFVALLATASSQNETVCQAELAAVEACKEDVGENATSIVTCQSCAEFVQTLNLQDGANCRQAENHICNDINDCTCDEDECGNEIKTWKKCEGIEALNLFGCESECDSAAGLPLAFAVAAVLISAIAML